MSNPAVGGVFLGPQNCPTWQSAFTVGFADFSVAALTNDISLFNLNGGGIIHAIRIKHSIAFTGAGINAYTLSIGIVGNLNKYATAFDVFQAPGNTIFQLSGGLHSEDAVAVTDVRIAAVCNVNLDNAATGSADIHLLTSSI